MSKEIVTTSAEIAKYVTWVLSDTIMKVCGKNLTKMPTWRATVAVQKRFQRAIEKGQMKDAPEALKGFRELLTILEGVNHESST